jgi:hypothetical protein
MNCAKLAVPLINTFWCSSRDSLQKKMNNNARKRAMEREGEDENGGNSSNGGCGNKEGKRKMPKRFNVVGAMENLGKEFVREAGEMAPETMADNLMPVLAHLLPEQEQQKRWCQQMIRRLGLEDAAIETPQLGAIAATTPARPVPQAAVTPVTEPRRAPTLVTPKHKIDPNEVMDWDGNAMYCHPTNPEIALCQSTASTQRCRLRNRLKAAIKTAGTKPSQAVVIHEYCTKVDPVLGQILQMVEDPERSIRVGEQTKHLIKQFLHSKSVYRTTNEARSFHLTVFKAMVPPHPKDDASRRTKELFQKKIKEFAN